MEDPLYIIKPSTRKDQRYIVVVNEGMMQHRFGSKSYRDYTDHNDEPQKSSYLKRHEVRENWTKSGIHTAGFWSR